MGAKSSLSSIPALILASASPRREEMLRGLGVEFMVVRSAVPELAPEHLSPAETAQINAYRKARATAKRFPDRLVLGADTIVSLGPDLFGKPRNVGEAERMLARLQGRTHQVITGVCLIHLRAHRQRLFAVSTAVTFRSLCHSGRRRPDRETHPRLVHECGGVAGRTAERRADGMEAVSRSDCLRSLCCDRSVQKARI
jgi:MAF protein